MSRPLIFCKNTKNFKQEEQLSMKMPNFSKISLFLVKFWGCPGFQPGRAVPGLAGLLGPSALRASVWPAATLIHPSAVAGQGLPGPISSLQNYPIT
ncbi:hypothetical protein SGRA_3755 [Saprospira grandis str. Lewin]|uniref:Uncharacterized protein n=1 Tax=Saprospira grandis (strain Lewin) TaxID=984262 RepID=H6L8A7_SAPGL|nr:hypothetical protein SGRA_3755 [Saprospira grandis str. Lewin]